MPAFRAPRGTRDLLPEERAVFDRLDADRDRASPTRYGYRPIETPLFEQAAVFERGIGEVTDVVEKELFRIAPRTEEAESWALRPEPTAGIVRAYVQHGMQTLPQPVKLTTTGPMFRYDRPQAGRYRQFWQFDVEAIGDPGPAIDAEIIELGHRFYAEAGVQGVEVLVNSIGDPACRPAYIAELVDYYRGHADVLPPTERDRLERNALRLLDSKDPAMAELNAAAPRITDQLCEACAAHFEAVKAHLDGARRAVPRRARASSAASTTTRAPRSSSTSRAARASSRRWAAAAGTTASSSCWAASRRPGSGSGWGWTGSPSCWRSRGSAEHAAVDGPLAVVVGADPDDTVGRLRVATDLRAARPPGPRGPRPAQARAPARGRRQGRRALRGDPGRRAADGHVQVRDLLAGTQRVVAIEDLARELARAEQHHKHG